MSDASEKKNQYGQPGPAGTTHPPKGTTTQPVRPALGTTHRIAPGGTTHRPIAPKGTTTHPLRPAEGTTHRIAPGGTTHPPTAPKGTTTNPLRPAGTTMRVKPENK